MSVINQMLKDLEQRRTAPDSSGAMLSGSSAFAYPNMPSTGRSDIMAQHRYKILLIIAIVMSIFAIWLWHKRDDVLQASPEISDIPSTTVVDTLSRVRSAEWQTDAHGLRLRLILDQPLAIPVTQTTQQRQIEFILSNTALNISVPAVDTDNEYLEWFSSEQIGQHLHLRLLHKPGITVHGYSTEQDKAEEETMDGHVWTLDIEKRFLPLLAQSQPAEQQSDNEIKTLSNNVPLQGEVRAARLPDVTFGAAESLPTQAAANMPDIAAEESSDAQIVTYNIKTPALSLPRIERYYQQALQDLQAENLTAAIDRLIKALHIKPHFHNARELLANIYLRLGRDAEAHMLLRQGIELAPAHLNFVNLYAHALIKRDQLREALQVLLRSEAYANTDAEYQALLAAVAQRLSNHTLAVKHYTLALDLENQRGAWWLGMAISLEALQQTEPAQQAYTAARRNTPANTELFDYIDSRLQQLSRQSS